MFDIYDQADNDNKKEDRKDEEEKVEIDGHDKKVYCKHYFDTG